MATSVEIMAEVTLKIAERIEAINSGDIEKRLEAKSVLQEKCNELNTAIKQEAHEVFLAEENPALACITAGYYPQYKLVDKVDKDGQAMVKLEDGREKQVDILYLNKLANKNIFPITTTAVITEFRKLLANFRGSEVGKTAKDMAAGGLVGAEKTVSVEALRKSLQKVYDTILFIDNGDGKNNILAKGTDAKQIAGWVFQKGIKLSEREKAITYIRDCVVDQMWAKINGVTLSISVAKEISF